MIISICQAISTFEENGLKKGKAYHLFIRAATTGEISINTNPGMNSEIIYLNLHDFLKAWQHITSLGYANNETDLHKLYLQIAQD